MIKDFECFMYIIGKIKILRQILLDESSVLMVMFEQYVVQVQVMRNIWGYVFNRYLWRFEREWEGLLSQCCWWSCKLYWVFGYIFYEHNVVGNDTYSTYTKMGVGM